MNISYSTPLSKGWERMKSALFQPFDLNNWLKLGFTAWLAGLCDCSGGGGGGHSNRGNSEWNEFFKFPGVAWEWLQSHPVWFSVIIAGIVVVITFGIVCLWLSSRGKFMFLYNVAYGKTEMGLPWNEYRKEGNSLFLWRLFFSLISIILLGIFLYYGFLSAKDMFYGDYPGILIFWNIATMVVIFFVYITSVGYTSLFLNDFVVPIMFKYRIGANHGWLKFLPLFGRYFFHFVLYGLFIFILIFIVVVGVIFFGLFTLLLGFILLAIPFIGSVVLLPVSYTFRALSIEFLAQFGEEFNVFPAIGQEE